MFIFQEATNLPSTNIQVFKGIFKNSDYEKVHATLFHIPSSNPPFWHSVEEQLPVFAGGMVSFAETEKNATHLGTSWLSSWDLLQEMLVKRYDISTRQLLVCPWGGDFRACHGVALFDSDSWLVTPIHKNKQMHGIAWSPSRGWFADIFHLSSPISAEIGFTSTPFAWNQDVLPLSSWLSTERSLDDIRNAFNFYPPNGWGKIENEIFKSRILPLIANNWRNFLTQEDFEIETDFLSKEMFSKTPWFIAVKPGVLRIRVELIKRNRIPMVLTGCTEKGDLRIMLIYPSNLSKRNGIFPEEGASYLVQIGCEAVLMGQGGEDVHAFLVPYLGETRYEDLQFKWGYPPRKALSIFALSAE
jgi:hypothetical protein